MYIDKIYKTVEKKQEASTVDKISMASLLFLSDSLFFDLMQEFKNQKNLDGNEIIYKIIRLFGGMNITVPSVHICTIYEYFAQKSTMITNGLETPEACVQFINQMRETLKLNGELTDAYLLSILTKYKKIMTREHITNMFEEQEGSEAAWTKSIAKLKKIKLLK